MVYKLRHSVAPAYVQDMFKRLFDCRSGNLRSTTIDIRVPSRRKINKQRGFLIEGSPSEVSCAKVLLLTRLHYSIIGDFQK